MQQDDKDLEQNEAYNEANYEQEEMEYHLFNAKVLADLAGLNQ